jgi:small subunit ribosomal protein S14
MFPFQNLLPHITSLVVIKHFISIQEVADQEVAALPRDSNYIRVRHRCALTSRPRGVVFKWRLSRIVWRHLADYNKLAGVQRAMW